MIDKSTFTIALIGAGNLATNLGKALKSAGYRITQVYSRTEVSAKELAELLSATHTTSLQEITDKADLYVVSLKDSAFEELLPQLVSGKENSLFVHTAGSIPMDIWKGHLSRYGVLYPMQTFSKRKKVDFKEIPVFIEAITETDLRTLNEIACDLSSSVYELSSEQRRYLHLSAVFACNFTNHLYALTEKLLDKYDLPFDVMLPLIDETTRKIHEFPPKEAQTGPAVRYDKNVINKHLELLSDEPDMQQLYKELSQSIHRINKEDKENK